MFALISESKFVKYKVEKFLPTIEIKSTGKGKIKLALDVRGCVEYSRN